MQKGQAGQVVVFHSSFFGVDENIADVDIILNDGKIQIFPRCSHQAALDLHEFIIKKSNHLLKIKNIPYASSETDPTDKFFLDIMNVSTHKKGVFYYIRTGAIFGKK